MPPLLRRILAVIAGAIVAVIIVSLSDALVARLAPLPADIDRRDAEQMRTAIAAVPPAAKVMLIVGWALAAGAGSFIAARLNPGRRLTPGLVVTTLVLLATIANLSAMPHPVWMWPAAILLVPLLGWAGARSGASPLPPAPRAAIG